MPKPYYWKRPNSLGEGEAARGLGGIVAPVLAGFCLSTVVVLVTAGDHKPPLAPVAIAVFSGSAVALLYAMQFSFLAVQRGSSPAEYIAWSPEARIDPDRLTELRREQAKDRYLFNRFWNRAGLFYDIGLIAFLMGLGLVVVPDKWGWWNAAAIALVAVAVVVEVVWFFSRWWELPIVIKWLIPAAQDVTDAEAPVDPLPPDYPAPS